jgi:hypothetical protein
LGFDEFGVAATDAAGFCAVATPTVFGVWLLAGELSDGEALVIGNGDCEFVFPVGGCLLDVAEIDGAAIEAPVVGALVEFVDGFPQSSAHRSFVSMRGDFFVSCGAAATDGVISKLRFCSVRVCVFVAFALRPIVAPDALALFPQVQSSAAGWLAAGGGDGGARTLCVVSWPDVWFSGKPGSLRLTTVVTGAPELLELNVASLDVGSCGINMGGAAADVMLLHSPFGPVETGAPLVDVPAGHICVEAAVVVVAVFEEPGHGGGCVRALELVDAGAAGCAKGFVKRG